MANVLYLTYDGLLEPLGQSQVLRYLEELAGRHDITLVSFEKKQDWDDWRLREGIADKVKRAGIHWIALRYHKRPSSLATAYDLMIVSLLSCLLVLQRRVAIVHARSYVAAVPALLLKKAFGKKFVFDMRGFWADERVERAGSSQGSAMYRVAKWFERRFFLHADAIVSLTHAGVAVIRQFPYLSGAAPYFEVIPTCTDLELFRLRPRPRPNSFVLGYVGSADTAYMFEPVLRCFKTLLGIRADARLLVVTRSSHDYVRALMQDLDIPQDRAEIKAVPHEQVALEMAKMDAAIFFVKPGFSACASVPTKLGELLGCGVPFLGNAGIGDIESILEQEAVGVVLRDFTPEAEQIGVSKLLQLCDDAEIRSRCAAVAGRLFSLQEGVRSYDRIYRAMAGGDL